ncbi:MAG TPA: serpin family protein [Thermoanaerobaculia bacterium]
MRSRLVLAVTAVLLLARTLGAEEAPGDGKEAAVRLAQSSNAFGFDLYQRLREKPGNLVLSPASITTALTMPWGGARGETAAQMRTVLHLQGTPDEVMATSGELSRSLQNPSRPIVFRIANQLFAEKTYKLVPAYVEKTKESFGAPLELLDFKKAPEPARVRINGWVEGKTERRIKDLIPPQGVEKDTRLVLVNAIYFLGDWAVPFDAGETRPRPFHLTAAEQKTVPTMSREGSMRYVQTEALSAVELPYKGGELSMLLLVPREIEGLAAIESGLNAKQLDEITGALKWGLVDLTLPKFEVKPVESLSLGEDLKAMGMPLAFDRDKADFTGIADPPNPIDRLVLAKVFHKGFVKVDEKGTEAAAATAVMSVMAGAAPGGPPRIVRIEVDRPFLFLIRDNASGLVIFLGRVNDPSRP